MSDHEDAPHTIGDLARDTGVPVRTIRFWSDEGIIPPAARSAAGYRLYDEAAAARVDLVRTLRDLGLDLPTVRRLLERQTTVAEVAAAHVRALDAEIRALRTRRALLAAVAHRESTTEEMTAMHKLAKLSAAERRRIIDDFVDATFAGVEDAAPGAGIAGAMRAIPATLPDEPTTAQVDAWIGLAELVEDEDFRTRARQMAVTGAMANPAEPPPFDSSAVAARCGAALDAGTDPASPEAATIVADLLTRPLTGEERRELADRIATFTSRKVERYWQLLGVLQGREPFPPAVPAHEWFIAALRASA